MVRQEPLRPDQPLEMGFEYRSAVRTVRTDSTGLIIPASTARFSLNESPWRSCKGGMMAGMSSLVRIVNAGVPGSQDRVDVVLREGVVASVGPAGTVSASDSTMQTKAHTTSLAYATNAIASGCVSIRTSASAPADETTIDAAAPGSARPAFAPNSRLPRRRSPPMMRK